MESMALSPPEAEATHAGEGEACAICGCGSPGSEPEAVGAPGDLMREVVALKELVAQLETAAAVAERERGTSWEEIGAALGVGKSRAHDRFAKAVTQSRDDADAAARRPPQKTARAHLQAGWNRVDELVRRRQIRRGLQSWAGSLHIGPNPGGTAGEGNTQPNGLDLCPRCHKDVDRSEGANTKRGHSAVGAAEPTPSAVATAAEKFDASTRDAWANMARQMGRDIQLRYLAEPTIAHIAAHGTRDVGSSVTCEDLAGLRTPAPEALLTILNACQSATNDSKVESALAEVLLNQLVHDVDGHRSEWLAAALLALRNPERNRAVSAAEARLRREISTAADVRYDELASRIEALEKRLEPES